MVWTLATTALAAVVALGADAATGLPSALERGATFDDAVVALSGAVAATVGIWLWVLTSWGVLDALRGRVPGRGGWWRRATMVACGCVATVVVTVPAHAGPADTPDSGAAAPVGSVRLLDGLPYPDRPTSAAHPRAPESSVADRPGAARPDTRVSRAGAPAGPTSAKPAAPPASRPREPRPARPETGPPPATPRGSTHVVRSGETLWSIATDALSRQRAAAAAPASPRDVARAVERIHAANRTTIGGDPDLVLPGQHLTLEGLQAPEREDHR